MEHMKPYTVIFIGPQGSGKGTQISRLDAHLRAIDPSRRIVDVQSGRRFRSFALLESGYTAEHIAATLDTGALQPLFLSVALWGYDFVQQVDPDCHLLIDGFPRAVEEAVVLETALSFYKREDLCVVFLDTPEAVVRERMIARARHDDTADSIEQRLLWYREKTLPVVEYYRAREKTHLVVVDGTQGIDAVALEIQKGLGLG